MFGASQKLISLGSFLFLELLSGFAIPEANGLLAV